MGCPNWHLFAELPPKPRQLQQLFNGHGHMARNGAPLNVTHRDVTVKGLDMLERLLTLDPTKRISATDALNHEYFWAEGRPVDPDMYIFCLVQFLPPLPIEDSAKNCELTACAAIFPKQVAEVSFAVCA